MVRILHVIDDKKFIEFCKATFEIDQNINFYVRSEDFPKKVQQESYDLIIIHFMRAQCTQTLIRQSIEVPVIWFFWGADGFQLGRFYNRLLLPKSKIINLRLGFKKGFTAGVNGLIKWIFPSLIDKTTFYSDLIKSIQKVDFIVPVMPGDFHLLKQYYTFKAELFHMNYIYGRMDQPIKEVSGQNVLLGNSASFTNNHMDIIDDLRQVLGTMPQAKLIVPLTYGNIHYAKYVQKHFENKMGNSVQCLMDFLPHEEYENIVSTCNIMIMNHIRQQAVGNIVFGLLSGIHVYLREESTTYAFLKGEGFHVGRIADLEHLRPLSEEERNRNKEIGAIVFGKATQHKKVGQLIKLVMAKN